MKRKTFIAILAIAMVLVLSLALLTACNNKKHNFSSKWEYDETSHWHECMTKNTRMWRIKRIILSTQALSQLPQPKPPRAC